MSIQYVWGTKSGLRKIKCKARILYQGGWQNANTGLTIIKAY